MVQIHVHLIVEEEGRAIVGKYYIWQQWRFLSLIQKTHDVFLPVLPLLLHQKLSVKERGRGLNILYVFSSYVKKLKRV